MRLPGLIAVLLVMSSACAAAPPAEIAPMVILPGHIDLARGPDGNTIILDAPDGLVVVDTGRHPEHAETILAHARKAGKPVAAIVNTHWHLDHTTGNRDILAAFPAAKLVTTRAVEGALDGFLARSKAQAEAELGAGQLSPEADARARRALAAVSDRAALVSPAPVERDGEGNVAGRRVEFRVARGAATEADLWLLVPDEKLAIAGDLVVGPVPFFDTGCAEGWRAALAAIDAAKWDRLVPGHGGVMDRAAFRRWRTAFEAFVDCARSSRPAHACADRWSSAAMEFYAADEAKDVAALARYYVESALRAPPDKQRPYCRAGG